MSSGTVGKPKQKSTSVALDGDKEMLVEKDTVVTEIGPPSFRHGEFKLTMLIRGYEMDELERCAGTELGRELVKEILRGTLENHTVTIADGVWERYPKLGQLVAEIRMEAKR